MKNEQKTSMNDAKEIFNHNMKLGGTKQFLVSCTKEQLEELLAGRPHTVVDASGIDSVPAVEGLPVFQNVTKASVEFHYDLQRKWFDECMGFVVWVSPEESDTPRTACHATSALQYLACHLFWIAL